RLHKNQLRKNNGRFRKFKNFKENFHNFGLEKEPEVKEEPGVEEDNIVLNKRKRGPYLVGLIKKSIYYNKWSLNSTYTVAASNTKNITGYFFSTKDSDNNIPSLDIADKVFEFLNNRNEEDEKSHKKMSIIEYNKKRAIFEYLQGLDKNDRGKMDANMKATKIVFINADSYKVIMIHIANRCKVWIHTQGSGVTPKTFKDFVENTLLIETDITKKKLFHLQQLSDSLIFLDFLLTSLSRHIL
ncbi:4973_t:CDS:2, partial [Funneliformis geosporum]